MLRVPAISARDTHSPWRDLVEGWHQFRAQTWLCVITVQFALFNLLTWAPFLLLGPLLAREYLGGARAWGTVTGAMALGSVLTGLALVGRTPRRPLVVGVIGSYGYAAPCLMLSLHLPVYAVAAGACAAGAGSAIFGTYFATVQQQRVPAEALARVTAFDLTGAYALGSVGLRRDRAGGGDRRPRPPAGIRGCIHGREQHRRAEPAGDPVRQATRACRSAARLG